MGTEKKRKTEWTRDGGVKGRKEEKTEITALSATAWGVQAAYSINSK